MFSSVSCIGTMKFASIILPCVCTAVMFMFSAKAGDPEIVKELRAAGFSGQVLTQSSRHFDRYRKVQNGACNKLVPLLVIRPLNTRDVATAVRVSRRFGLPISVRSGGHSYTCTNMKSGSLHFDLRRLNKVQLIPANHEHVSTSDAEALIGIYLYV